MRFEFATATRIVFGAGTLAEVAPAAAGMGSRALLVTGRKPDQTEPLAAHLRDASLDPVAFPVTSEPTIPLVEQGTDLALRERCDVVVAFGGGSAIDTGKAIAALLANGGSPLDYLEVIGQGQKITKPSAPLIAVPTTAGTGCEVTRNAVLASPEHRVKASLRSPLMLPHLAVVDPETTLLLPPGLTAATGMDALTQLIEPYVSVRANPLVDAICLEGIRRAARSLERAYTNGNDLDARTDMALASLFGGLALANAGLGAVHGFAAPIGGMFPAPHGAVCAALLPLVMDANIAALRSREPENPALARYQTVAQILTGNPKALPEDGVTRAEVIVSALAIHRLRAWGIRQDDVPVLVENAARASSMKGNPIVLTSDELAGILRRAV